MAAPRNPGRAASPDRDRSAGNTPAESAAGTDAAGADAAGTDNDPLSLFGGGPDLDRLDDTDVSDGAGADPIDLFGGGLDLDLLDDDDVSASDLDLPDEAPAAGGPLTGELATGDLVAIDDSTAAADAGIDDVDAADFAHSFEPRWSGGAIEDDMSMPVDVDETDLAALRAASMASAGGPARGLRDGGLPDPVLPDLVLPNAVLADGEAPIDLTRDMRADHDDNDALLLGPTDMPVPPPATGGRNWLMSPWAYGVVACMLVLAGYELFMNGSSAWVYRIY